jgi:hypothetical protein
MTIFVVFVEINLIINKMKLQEKIHNQKEKLSLWKKIEKELKLTEFETLTLSWFLINIDARGELNFIKIQNWLNKKNSTYKEIAKEIEDWFKKLIPLIWIKRIEVYTKYGNIDT